MRIEYSLTPGIRRPDLLLLFLLLVLFVPCLGQQYNVSGTITDSQTKPIPFATVYIKELSKGLSTGEDGEFSLILPRGNYTLKIQSIGYKPETRPVKLADKDIRLTVSLQELTYELKEVVVSGKENPANRIMRAAIARGAYFKKLLKSYEAEVYVKSGQKLEKISDLVKLLTKNDAEMPSVGELYFAESYNKVEYEAPDHYVQTVVKAQTSKNPLGGNEIPGVRFLTTDFFQPVIMDAPSPLGKNAFSAYHYLLEGISSSDTQAVYKIRVIPKRPGMFFRGYLYIENRNYLLKAIDLDLEASILTFNIRMDYEEVRGALILPASFLMKFKVSLLGNDYTGQTSSSIVYNKIILDSAFRYPAGFNYAGRDKGGDDTVTFRSAREEKLQGDMDRLLSKPDMSMNDMNKLMRLMKKQEKEGKKDSIISLEIKDPVITKKDSLYKQHNTAWWQQKRPVPLSPEESNANGKIDSMHMTRSNKGDNSISDTLKEKRPDAWYNYPLRLLAGGSLWEDSIWSFKTNGLLLNTSYYSPVDGFTLASRFEFTRKSSSSRNPAGISVKPMYSFAREEFMTEAEAWMGYSRLHPSRISLRYFSLSDDLNNTHPVDRNVNSLTTLILHQNHLKQIHDEGIRIRNESELVNGLQLGLGAEIHNRQVLENNSNYSFPYKDSLFPSNYPDNPRLQEFPLTDHRHTVLTFSLQYTHKNRYRIRNNRKFNVGSAYPVVKFEYLQGIRTPPTDDINFSRFIFSVRQVIDLGIFTEIRYNIKAGTSLSSDHMQFSEFYHPAVDEIPFSFHSTTNSFFLIPNYRYSTTDAFVDAHAHYESTCILIKRMPWLSRKLITEKVGLSWFTSKKTEYYNELFYGLGKIYFGGEALVVAGFRGGNHTHTGLRLSFNFK